MSKKLVVNADDFGRTPGVNEGILKAAREGIVTSTTAMMNMPGAAAALQRAKTECPNLGLGVHLVFTVGRPLLPPEWVSSLVDKHGVFISEAQVFADPDHVDPGELKAELKAQIKTFQNAMGEMPDHLDAHHFAHLLPRFFEVYLALAQEFHLPARIPIPRTPAAWEARPLPAIHNLAPEQVKAIAQADWELLAKYPVRSTDHFIMSFFGDEALTLTSLQHILDSLPEGKTELMTHPGLADEMLLKQSRYTRQREKELELLCHPAIKQHVADLGVRLITFAGV